VTAARERGREVRVERNLAVPIPAGAWVRSDLGRPTGGGWP
jgi:hypothetical protein